MFTAGSGALRQTYEIVNILHCRLATRRDALQLRVRAPGDKWLSRFRDLARPLRNF
jgi:hypothetical protein